MLYAAADPVLTGSFLLGWHEPAYCWFIIAVQLLCCFLLLREMLYHVQHPMLATSVPVFMNYSCIYELQQRPPLPRGCMTCMARCLHVLGMRRGMDLAVHGNITASLLLFAL